MENKTRREGRPVDQVGFYNSITKRLYINDRKNLKWLSYGVQPTNNVFRLLQFTLSSRRQDIRNQLENHIKKDKKRKFKKALFRPALLNQNQINQLENSKIYAYELQTIIKN